MLPIELVSEPDNGISDAYAKGFRRAIGDLVMASSADERLDPEALAIANRWFEEEPDDAIVCCGRTDFIDPPELSRPAFRPRASTSKVT